MKTIKLKQSILEKIKDHAHKDSPLEACGYLGGKQNLISAIYPITNLDQSTEHFTFDPKEQFSVLKKARKQGHKLLAIYHSHPVSAPYMSKEDMRLAYDPEITYFIYSLLKNEIKAFQANRGKQFNEISIEVIP